MLFLGFLGLYIYTLAPSVATQGDSGELVTVASRLGIAHSPGYPVYTLVGYLFSLLPFGSLAWRLNLFSAVTHAATLVVFALIIWEVTKSRLAAIGGGIVLGISYTFWLYSLIAEVFPLNNLFALLLFYLAVKKKFLWMAMVFGLSLGNHQTIVLILPALAYLVWPHRRKILNRKYIILSLIFLTIGLLPYLYIYLRARTGVDPAFWAYPDTLPGLVKYFLRSEYGTLSPLRGYEPGLATLADKWQQIIKYGLFLIEDFGYLVVTAIVSGFVLGLKDHKRFLITFAIAFLSAGPLFLTYANFPLQDETGTVIAILERFYLLPNIFLALLFGLSLASLEKFAAKRIWKFTLAAALVIQIAVLGASHYPDVNQRDNFLGRDIAYNLLATAPANALVIMQGDIAMFTSYYLRYAENFRPDVELVMAHSIISNYPYRYLRQARPELNLQGPKAYYLKGLLEENYPKAPFMIIEQPVRPVPGWPASSSGILARFYSPEDVPDFPTWKASLTDIFAQYRLPSGWVTLGDFATVDYYARVYMIIADTYFKNSDFAGAREWYQKILVLEPEKTIAYYWIGRVFAKEGNCREAERNYLLAMELNPGAKVIFKDLTDLADGCFKDQAKADFYRNELKKSDAGDSAVNLEKL